MDADPGVGTAVVVGLYSRLRIQDDRLAVESGDIYVRSRGEHILFPGLQAYCNGEVLFNVPDGAVKTVSVRTGRVVLTLGEREIQLAGGQSMKMLPEPHEVPYLPSLPAALKVGLDTLESLDKAAE